MIGFYIGYAIAAGAFLLSVVLTIAGIISQISTYEIFLSIILLLVTGYFWAGVAEKLMNYPVLGRIYKRLSDDYKIYALYIYEAIGYITVGLILIVVFLAIGNSLLIEKDNPGIRDIITVVVSLIVLVLVEIPLAGKIFRFHVPEDYTLFIILSGTSFFGLFLFLGGLSMFAIPLMIVGLGFFLPCAYGAFLKLNNMLKIVGKEKIAEIDSEISKVVEAGVYIGLGLAYGDDGTSDSYFGSKALKAKTIVKLVGEIIGVILVAAFYIFVLIVDFTPFTFIVASAVCLTGIFVLIKDIRNNIKTIRSWKNDNIE